MNDENTDGIKNKLLNARSSIKLRSRDSTLPNTPLRLLALIGQKRRLATLRLARPAAGRVQWAAAPAFPRPFAVRWRLRRVTVAGLRSDDGGLGARRLRAERCSREVAIHHGGSSGTEGPVLPAPRSTALPPAADEALGGARGHGAEPGEELLTLPISVPGSPGSPLVPPLDLWPRLSAPGWYTL